MYLYYFKYISRIDSLILCIKATKPGFTTSALNDAAIAIVVIVIDDGHAALSRATFKCIRIIIATIPAITTIIVTIIAIVNN